MVLLSRTGLKAHFLSNLSQLECEQLIKRYQQYGLIASRDALQRPSFFAAKLTKEPVAVAICRILNDFRPLDDIVESLWDAASAEDHFAYLTVALAQHCYSAGLRYSILQKIMGTSYSIDILLSKAVPLRITQHAAENNFVIPTHAVIGQKILQRASKNKPEKLFDVFCKLAIGLAPHVNRNTIKNRTPESRLTSRVLDADKVVRPFLGSYAEKLYDNIQDTCAWNSRFWEQRALLVAESNIDNALQYARHAVAIEKHPFPLTTLGRILLLKMKKTEADRESLVLEALGVLSDAIRKEEDGSRISVHPYSVLFEGVAQYIQLSGRSLPLRQNDQVRTFMLNAGTYFKYDVNITN